ncbi:hypothetical protein MBRA_03181 [Methylobacterium brachiatum]|nr:hypothetical protein MBRA_03181 [Methylobacterium brachiatum]
MATHRPVRGRRRPRRRHSGSPQASSDFRATGGARAWRLGIPGSAARPQDDGAWRHRSSLGLQNKTERFAVERDESSSLCHPWRVRERAPGQTRGCVGSPASAGMSLRITHLCAAPCNQIQTLGARQILPGARQVRPRGKRHACTPPRKHVCVQPLTETVRWPGPCSIRSERSLIMASGAADRLDVSGWIPAARTSSTPRSSWDAAGVAARAGDSSQDRFGAALSAARARDDVAASRARVDARRDQADAARTASERARDAADTAKARAAAVPRPAPPIPCGRQRPASRLRSCRRPRRGPPNR